MILTFILNIISSFTKMDFANYTSLEMLLDSKLFSIEVVLKGFFFQLIF